RLGRLYHLRAAGILLGGDQAAIDVAIGEAKIDRILVAPGERPLIDQAGLHEPLYLGSVRIAEHDAGKQGEAAVGARGFGVDLLLAQQIETPAARPDRRTRHVIDIRTVIVAAEAILAGEAEDGVGRIP